jgi:hypothetical protein
MVPRAQKEHEDLFLILIDPLATVKKSNMSDPQQPSPLQPVTPQDWINLIQHNQEGFRAILSTMVTQGIVPAALAPTPAQATSHKRSTPNPVPLQQGRHSLATQAHQRDHHWSHHSHGGTQGLHSKALATTTNKQRDG